MTELETAIADNRMAVEEFIARARGIDAAAWSAPRGEGKWSPAQIVEHLAIVYEYNRKVVTGDAGGGAPRFLQPLARWFMIWLYSASASEGGTSCSSASSPSGTRSTRNPRPGW